MIENDKIKLTAIIVGLVIFFAYMKQYVFYYYFNIDISNYLSIHEVFTPFIDDIVLWVAYILILVVFLLMDIPNPKNKTSVNTEYKPNISVNIMLLVFLTLLNIGAFFTTTVWLALFIFTPILIINLVILFLKNKIEFIRDFRLKKPNEFMFYEQIFYIFNVSMFASMITLSLLTLEVYKILNLNFKKIQYICEFENATKITTDSTILYIGRTESKIFFIDRTKQTYKVDIYNTSEIKKEQIIELEQK